MPTLRPRLVIAALVLAGLGVGVWMRSSEVVRPPASLSPTARAEPTPDERDAVALVAQAAGRIRTLPGVGDDLAQALQPDGPPAPEDRGAWRRYARGLEPLEAALAKPGALHAEWDGAGAGEAPLLVPWQWLGSALVVRGWDRGLDGEVDGGLRDMLLAVELGRRTRGASTWVVPTAVGDGIINRAAVEIEQYVRTFGSSDPALHEAAILGLEAALEDPPLMWRAVQADCASWIRQGVSDFAARPYIELPPIGGPFPRYASRVNLPMVFAPVLLDARTTYAEGARRCEQQAAIARLPYPERPSQPPAPAGSGEEADWFVNHAGTEILADTVNYPMVVVREDQARARVAGVWSVLSARRWWLVEGALPTSVQLPLPHDPFSDRPFAIVDGVILSAGEAATHPNTPLRWVVLP